MNEFTKVDTGVRNLLKRVRILVIGNRILLVAVVFIIFLLVSFGWMLCQVPEGMIARGVTIGPLDVGGVSKDQALHVMQAQVDVLENQGINFVYKNINLPILSVYSPQNNPELSREIFKYNAGDTVEQAYKVGREYEGWQKYWRRLIVRLFGKKIQPSYTFDSDQVRQVFEQNLSGFEDQPVDANLEVRWKSNNNPEVVSIEEKTGKVFDYGEGVSEFKNRLDNLDSSQVLLRLKTIEPKLLVKNVVLLKPKLEEILKQGDLSITYQDKKITAKRETWALWITVSSKDGSNEGFLSLNEKADKFLETDVAPQIEKPVQEAKFLMKDGKVAEFQAGEVGQKIDLIAAKEEIKKALFEGSLTAGLSLVETAPSVNVDKINDLGIKELVSVGKTNFAGSPTNRRINIKVGANALSGILIAPGEEFSTIKKLSPIDASNGYVPELVIKGNKTKPEYGGGLCQISTTLFRAVLNAGLPILERSNHAYRVSYYEPPVGYDATIYDPKPDFRFVNDTGHYLLLQAKIQGNDLSFEFWGTKDGRTITQTAPKQFNYQPAPPAKLIETLDLPVGQKKCTEKAHAGISTSFNYTVVYAGGEKKSEDFFSRYKPWGEVCMIGVEKLSDPATAGDLVTPTIPIVPPVVSTSTVTP